MNDSDDIEALLELLQAAELNTELVPVNTDPRCDLRACDGTAQYLIEVKGFHPDEGMISTLRQGELYESHQSLFRSNKIAKIVNKAVRQLTSSAVGYPDDIRVVALFVRNRHFGDLTLNQIIGMLYGVTSIVDLDASGPLTSRDCLYFHHSIFFKHRYNLDCVLIFDNADAGLLLNDFSPRRDQVRSSRLGRYFGDLGLLHDASKVERERGFLVADCAVDRNDHFGVLKYLAKKYNMRKPIYLTPHDYAAVARA